MYPYTWKFYWTEKNKEICKSIYRSREIVLFEVTWIQTYKWQMSELTMDLKTENLDCVFTLDFMVKGAKKQVRD